MNRRSFLAALAVLPFAGRPAAATPAVAAVPAPSTEWVYPELEDDWKLLTYVSGPVASSPPAFFIDEAGWLNLRGVVEDGAKYLLPAEAAPDRTILCPLKPPADDCGAYAKIDPLGFVEGHLYPIPWNQESP